MMPIEGYPRTRTSKVTFESRTLTSYYTTGEAEEVGDLTDDKRHVQFQMHGVPCPLRAAPHPP